MTTFETIMIAIGLGMSTVALLRLPAFWRGEAADLPHDPYPGWPFGVPLWRALKRTFPADIGAIWFVTAGVLADEILPSRNPAVVAFVVVTITISIVFLVLAVRVALYNRPQWIVIPYERDDPGLLDEWRQSQKPRPPNDGSR